MGGDAFDLGDDEPDTEASTDDPTNAGEPDANTGGSQARNNGRTADRQGRDRGRDRGGDTGGMDEQAERTRDRTQYANYLPAALVEEIDGWFEDLNAERQLADEPTLEKHKGFNEAVWRYVLAELEDEEIVAYARAYGFVDE